MIFGNKKGLEWWGIMRDLDHALAEAQKNYDREPTPENLAKLEQAKRDLVQSPAYYD